jgi:hypothetical protein
MQRILGEREEELGPRRLYVYPFGKIAQKLAICMKGEGGFVDAQTHTIILTGGPGRKLSGMAKV